MTEILLIALVAFVYWRLTRRIDAQDRTLRELLQIIRDRAK